MTLISFPILYLSLELPKWIINDALSSKFTPKLLWGWTLDAAPYLVILCISLLVLIVVNGLLKMRINTIKGVIGERMVRRLRYVLIDRMLGFPIRHFSKISQGELIATVTAETEPLAGYIGEAVALPLFQGGTMITILIFMFMQNWVLGLSAIALIPLQI
jgi:ABC-type multidrug transport system fused ATPase/permease subunit